MNIYTKYVLIVFLLLFTRGYSQEKFNISLGIGFVEFFNVGTRYQIDQVQLGVNVGAWPNSELYSYSGDFRFHFGDTSQFTNLKCWFMLFGINSVQNKASNRNSITHFFKTKIGRDINISKNAGINLSAGILFPLTNNDKDSPGEPDGGGVSVSILPSIGFEFFIRF